MADKLDEPEFWLPSEFLTDEDILMDNKENVSKILGLCFPTEFQCDYGFSVLNSPVESVVGSTETESDEEDFLLTGLTRQLSLLETQKPTPTHQNHEKAWVLSGSPQSTLVQVGSWSGRSTISSNGSPNGPSQVSSPPTTPLGVNNDPWDLIYKAAGQVARLKMNGGGGEGLTRNPGLLGPPRSFTAQPLRNSPPSALYHPQFQQQKAREVQMVKQETSGFWSSQVKNGWVYDSEDVSQNIGGRIGMYFGSGGGMGQQSCGWPVQQHDQHRNQQQLCGELGLKGKVYSGCGYGYGFGCGSGGGGGGCGGLKRGRAGTGVFLPRRYDDNNNLKLSQSRKKPGCSAAWLPNKVSQSSNKNIGDIHAVVEPKSQYNGGFIGDYDALFARRNALLARRSALLAQQMRSLCPEGFVSHEVCLPQEWTY